MRQYYSITQICSGLRIDADNVLRYLYPVDLVSDGLLEELKNGDRELIVEMNMKHVRDDIWVFSEFYDDFMEYEGEQEDIEDEFNIYHYSGLVEEEILWLNKKGIILNDIQIVDSFVVVF